MIKRHDLVEKILTFLGLACPATVWDKIVLVFYFKKKKAARHISGLFVF